MPRSNNNAHQITAEDILEARRIAESNATTNHFLGATPRPWMTGSIIRPHLPAERYVLHSDDSGVANYLPRPDAPAAAETARPADSHNQERERPLRAQSHATSPTIPILPASHSGSGDASRKRSLDISNLEAGPSQRSVRTQTQRPGPTSLVLSPEVEQAPSVYLGPPLSAANDLYKILSSAMHSLNNFQTSTGRLNKVEWPRISLLRDACFQGDAFYLCLHQLFCIGFMNPRRTLETGYGEAQYAGLSLLTLVLLSNQDVTPEVLKFFVDLPASLERLIQESSPYRNIIGKVGVFLQRFAAGWDRLRDECLARKYPPFVDELVTAFELHSPVLQKILFNSIHRQLGATENTQWSREGLLLFAHNQSQCQLRKLNHGELATGSRAAVLGEQRRLGDKYKSLRESALNPVVQRAPVRNMATTEPVRPLRLSLQTIAPPQAALSPSMQYGTNIANPQWSPVSNPQWSSLSNPSSRPQSVNAPGVGNRSASTATPGPHPPPPVRQLSLSSTMSSPFHTPQSAAEAHRHTWPLQAPSPGAQQPIPQRRRGRPPPSSSSDRPAIPHATTPTTPAGRAITWAPPSYPGYLPSHPPVPQSTNHNALPSPGYPGYLPSRPPVPQSISQNALPSPSYPGHVPPRPPVPQSISHNALLIPALGHEPIQTSMPDPLRLALHQAYLRSPVATKLNSTGQTTADMRLYQYVSAFAIPPTIIGIGVALHSSEFLVTATELSKKAVDINASDGQVTRLLSDGTVLYRLRSIEAVRDVHIIEEAAWSVAETCWAPSCFVRINHVDIELRRRLHHGKDLPVDLTPHVQQGTNTLTIAFLHRPNEPKPKRFAIAVELLEVGDQTRVDAAPSLVSAADSLRAITQGLALPPRRKPADHHDDDDDNNAAAAAAAADDEDDEVQVVDSHLSIDLIDPFMATIFTIPARGKTCTHRECFDLATFFQTRKSRCKGGPTSPDEWKCPICRKDARPGSMVVDSFLKTVRDSLVGASAAVDARAILIGRDGRWTVKRDGVEGKGMGRGGAREGSNVTVGGSPVVAGMGDGGRGGESVVIEIQDD